MRVDAKRNLLAFLYIATSCSDNAFAVFLMFIKDCKLKSMWAIWKSGKGNYLFEVIKTTLYFANCFFF
jgi:hypothetical protein